jgi:hypothetical protein
MNINILHFVSTEQSRSYDFFAMAPADVDLGTAVVRANKVINEKNAEDSRNCDSGGEGCDDGLCVETSIKAALQKEGFLFDGVNVERTQEWDGTH